MHHTSPKVGKLGGALTDGVDIDVNARGQNLVPPVNTPYQPATAVKAASAAKWVREGGVGCKVTFDCCTLQGRRGLS